MRLLTRARLGLLTLAAALVAAPTLVAPPPAGAATCHAYQVIGVRGSGESVEDGGFGMGGKVDPYVAAAGAYLPSGSTDYVTLPYMAVSAMSTPDRYQASVADGISMLRQTIITTLQSCPATHIGLVGYSQGAEVITEGLRSLTPGQLTSLRGVLLIADPRSDNTQFYHRAIGPNGDASPLETRGGLLGRLALPPAVRTRARDICIYGDIVCDASPDSATLLGEAMTTEIHSRYGSFVNNAVRSYGQEFGYRVALSLDWHAFGSIDGTGTSDPGVGTRPTGELDVVVKGTDDAIYHRWWTQAHGWSAWERFPDLIANAAPSITTRPNGEVDVAARDTNRQVRVRRWTPQAGWTLWETVPGAPIYSAPAIAARPDGTLDLFFRMGDLKTIGHQTWTPTGGWGGVETLPGLSAISSPAALDGPGGTVEVAVQGSDNTIYAKLWRPSSGWTAWNNMGLAATSAPSLAQRPDGQVDVVARGSNNAVMHRVYGPNGPGPWTSLGGTATSAPAVGARVTGEVDVVVLQGSGTVYHSWWGSPLVVPFP